MVRLLNLFLLFLACSAGHAQQVQKCCGTSNSTFLLGNTGFARHSQCLYLPAELTGAQPGHITRLYYRYGSTGIDVDQTLTELQIGFLQNQATNFPGNLFYTDVTPAYYSVSQVIPAGTTGEWFYFELDQPFEYDPALSLIVDIKFETSSTSNFGTLATSAPGRKLYASDLDSPTGETTVSTLQDVGFDLDGSTFVSGLANEPFMLFPNPAREQAWLHDPSATRPMLVQVMDMCGRIVQQSNLDITTPTPLSIGGLSPGSYIVRSIDRAGTTRSSVLLRE